MASYYKETNYSHVKGIPWKSISYTLTHSYFSINLLHAEK